MKKFLADNWDKLLTALVAAVAGYFAAIRAVDADISAVRERVVALESTEGGGWEAV